MEMDGLKKLSFLLLGGPEKGRSERKRMWFFLKEV